jgi:hypothetical protein
MAARKKKEEREEAYIYIYTKPRPINHFLSQSISLTTTKSNHRTLIERTGCQLPLVAARKKKEERGGL